MKTTATAKVVDQGMVLYFGPDPVYRVLLSLNSNGENRLQLFQATRVASHSASDWLAVSTNHQGSNAIVMPENSYSRSSVPTLLDRDNSLIDLGHGWLLTCLGKIRGSTYSKGRTSIEGRVSHTLGSLWSLAYS